MRIAALILGILGGLAAGFLGYKWYSDYQAHKELADALAGTAAGGELESLVTASYVLMAGFVAGIAGGVMALKGNGKIGGIVMLAFGVLPGVFAPKAFVFTSVLIIAGVVALLAKPKAAVPATA